MSENYEEKKVYYIPAFVERIEELGNYPVKVSFRIGEERCAVQFENSPDLLFTAEEVAKENDLYTSIHGEVVVVTENKKLKAKVASLQEEKDRVTAWYKEANKTASEAAEANDELKAKVAELEAENGSLRSQVGGYAVNVKDLASDVDFFKTDRDKWLDTAQDNAKLVDALQEENKDLKRKLEIVEAARDGAVDEIIERKNRVTTMEEVIVALVEKIRRLECED